MIERRPFDELASEDLGWLKARRHFSSAAYDDPSRSGCGGMRVWNDEEIAPNAGLAQQVHGGHDESELKVVRQALDAVGAFLAERGFRRKSVSEFSDTEAGSRVDIESHISGRKS
jgi:hypothetical protein